MPQSRAVRHSSVLHWLTAFLLVLFAIPAWLVVGPLGSAGSPSTLLGLASALLWFLAHLVPPRGGAGPGSPWPIRVALAVYLFVVGVSYAVAMAGPISHDEVSPADLALLQAVAWAGVLLVTHDGLGDREEVDALVRRLSVAGALMACVGLAQMLTDQLLVDAIVIPGLRVRGDIEASFRHGLLRMSGTAASPIEFGALLTVVLPLAIHHALHPTGRGRFLRWFPVAAISLALALSLSRTAYVGIGVAMVVLLLGWPRRQRWVTLGVVVLGAALVTILAPRVFRAVREMFLTADEDPSIASRTDSYAVVWEFFRNAPLLGRGPGTFLPKYRILDNQYLGLLLNVGIVGLLAFVALFVVTVVVLLRYRRRCRDAAGRDLALSLVSALTAGAVSLAFFDAFAFPMIMGTLFLTMGLVGALVRHVPVTGPASPRHAAAPGQHEPPAEAAHLGEGRSGQQADQAEVHQQDGTADGHD